MDRAIILSAMVIMSNAVDYCISGDHQLNGNYESGGTDANGNEYWKFPAGNNCYSNDDFYIYKKSDKWQTGPTLGGNSYYHRCPDTTAATPDACGQPWKNGPADFAVGSACPIPVVTELDCSNIQVTGSLHSTNCDGVFIKSAKNLYIKEPETGCSGGTFYWYYREKDNMWECSATDARDRCFSGSLSYYSRSSDDWASKISEGAAAISVSIFVSTHQSTAELKCGVSIPATSNVFSDGYCVSGVGTDTPQSINSFLNGYYTKQLDASNNEIMNDGRPVYKITQTGSGCNPAYLYYSCARSKWTFSTSVGGAQYLGCLTNNKGQNPTQCTKWSQSGVTISTQNCPILSCGSNLQVTDFAAVSACNGLFVKSADNVYVSADKKYWYYNSPTQKFICGGKDDRFVCNGFSQYSGAHTSQFGPPSIPSGQQVSVELGGGSSNWQCDVATPAPVTPSPTSGDDICVTIDEGGSLNWLSGIFVKQPGDIDGFPYYKWQCGTGNDHFYFFYSTYFKRWYYSKGITINAGYYAYCSTTDANLVNCNGNWMMVSPQLNPVISSANGVSCRSCDSSAHAVLPQILGPSTLNNPDPKILNNPDPNTLNKVNLYDQFLNAIKTETGAIILSWIFVMLCVWSVTMCAYQVGFRRANIKKGYIKAKIINDRV